MSLHTRQAGREKDADKKSEEFVTKGKKKSGPLFVPQWEIYSVSLYNQHRLPEEALLGICGPSGN